MNDSPLVLPFDPSGIALDRRRGLSQQLYQALRARVLDGRLSSGTRLPATLHLTVTAATADRVPALLADLADAARAAVQLPPPVPDPGLVAAAEGLDPAALTVADVDGLLAFAGLDGGPLPARMAPVHALVAALPRPVAERLLTGVLDRVYRPTR